MIGHMFDKKFHQDQPSTRRSDTVAPRLRRLPTRLTRVITSGGRRDHDGAMRDPRVAWEHDVARSRATSRGERDCIYCS